MRRYCDATVVPRVYRTVETRAVRRRLLRVGTVICEQQSTCRLVEDEVRPAAEDRARY